MKSPPVIPRFVEVAGLADYFRDYTLWVKEAIGNQPVQDRYQPYDANLQSLSNPFGLTAAGRALLDDADAAAQLTTLGFSAFVKTLVDDASAAALLASLNITPWVAYTPTLTGFGTPSGVTVFSKRIGDTLYVYGKFTSGISTAVEARMSLGFNGTNGGIVSDAAKIPAILIAGYGTRTQAATTLFDWRVLIESGVGYVTFGHQLSTTAAVNKLLGNGFLASGEAFYFQFQVPISGW